MNSIKIDNATVTFSDFTIDSKVIAQHLSTLEEDQLADAIKNALEVGIYSLQRAQTGQDLEFVRRQVEALLQDVQAKTASIPEELRKQVLKEIGTEKGQALEPIIRASKEVEAGMSRQLRDLQSLLIDDIDPKSTESTLGKALATIGQLLDPNRTDSLQAAFTGAISKVGASDGELAATFADVISKALKPLQSEVDELGKEIRSQRDTRDALNNTTAKGVIYEEELVERLQQWSSRSGFTVEHVGTDNKPGDILITRLASNGQQEISIVVEAKDKQSRDGRKPITKSLRRAMNEAKADAGIFVNRDVGGFANEIGDWAEGVEAEGEWIACTDEHLIAAIRMLVCKVELSRMREEQAVQTDTTSIMNHMMRIRTAIKKVANINRNVTTIRTSADSIRTEAEDLRDEIRDALISIEDALQEVPAKAARTVSGDGVASKSVPHIAQTSFLS